MPLVHAARAVRAEALGGIPPPSVAEESEMRFSDRSFLNLRVFFLNERDFSHGLYNRFITLPPQPGTQIGQLIVSGRVRD